MGLRPKINIDVNSALGLIAQGGNAVCTIIGTAQWGPVDEVQIITNFNEGLTLFKEDLSGADLTLIKGLDLLYANGAGTVKAIRVADTEAARSNLTLLNSSTSAIEVYGKYKGSYGNNIMVTVTANATTPTSRDVELTDGSSVETYNAGGVGYTSNAAIVTAINANSGMCTATSLIDYTLIVDALTQTNLSGGDSGEDGTVQADYTNLLDDELYNQDYDILLIPGQTDDSFHSAIVGRLDSRAANDDLFSVYFSGIDTDETITTAQARTASGRRLTLCAPAVKYNNRVSGTEQTLDGSYLACAYAGKTSTGWPELSATHKTLSISGLSVLASSGKEYYNNGEQEVLLAARIVPVTKIAGALQAARAITRHSSTTEVWYEQNIVDIVDYVKEQILVLLNPFVGKPNLSRIRTVMAKNVDGILEQDKLDEIIVDYIPTQVTEGASPDTVNVSMTIKPTFLVNFINVTLTLDNTDN